MNVVELIRKKRQGDTLTEEEMRFLISGYVNGTVPDYQMSAFLMAVYFNSMSDEETVTFTDLMMHSGEVVDLSDIPGVKVDKHSTGGVGDKVSLIVAPIVAACGVPVPMISGRGLGHTGGTLDKLESIPGFNTNLSIQDYKRVIKKTGLVMIGQTKEIAPADKKMYALRDVTSTVECIPLIASSILSKKLAEGIDALVLDVKTGRGAFMQSYDRALSLALTIVNIGTASGKETVAFITEMSQPLGFAIGNWVEVVESIECLQGKRGGNDHSADLMYISHVLAGAMLMAGKKVSTIEGGIAQSKSAIANGSAYNKFLELVKIQGGDVSALEHLERYPISNHTLAVVSSHKGYVSEIDSLELGMTAITLGAGRQTMEDRIDHKAGIILKKKVGDRVELGETLAVLHTDREQILTTAHHRTANAFAISATKPEPPPLVHTIITKDGVKPWTH